jgi:hypothetical protein
MYVCDTDCILQVAWLATWKDNIFGESKYVLFAASSSLRGKTDREKYETARKLKVYSSIDFYLFVQSQLQRTSNKYLFLFVSDVY